MYKEVKINIPLFIGIILLIVAVTAILVLGVNQTIELILDSNRQLDEQFERWENLINEKFELNGSDEVDDIGTNETPEEI